MKIFAVLLVALLPIYKLQADSELEKQEEKPTPVMTVGGFAAYGWNAHLSNFKALPGVPCCSPVFEKGSGNGLSAGLLVELPVAGNNRVQLRLGYEGLHGTLRRNEVIGNTLVRSAVAPFDTTTVDITSQHSIEATLNAIFLEPTFVYSFPTSYPIGLQVGVSGAWLLTREFYQKEELQSPATVVFTGTESRIRNEATGTIPQVKPLLFHAVAGLSVDFPVSNAAVFSPEVRLRLPLNSIAGVDWKVGALAVGAAFKMNIFPPKQFRYEQDTLLQRDTVQQLIADLETEQVRLLRTEESTSQVRDGAVIRQTIIRNEYYVREHPAPRLSVGLSVEGMTLDGKKTEVPIVVVEEVLTQESFPLVPYVFFDHTAASLQPLLSRMTKLDVFDTTALRFSALAIHDELLNIIGARMQRFPASTIVITGCNSGDGENNSRPLSKQRAREVRQFLATVWHIDMKRMTIKNRDLPAYPSNNATEDGRAENRRVEISSLDGRLLEPVVLRTIERTVTPPVLVFQPTVSVATPATPWQLSAVRQQEHVFDTAGVGTPPAVHWRPDAGLLSTEASFTARLSATDDYGRTATAEQRVPVRQSTISRDRDENEQVRVERFSLVLFDFNSADIDRNNLHLVEQIRRRIRPGAQVRILGYTDRTGDAEYNKKLAYRRCYEVQKLLGVTDAHIEAVGSDRLLFDNDIPAGRMYSRTVHIIIETPVEKPESSN